MSNPKNSYRPITSPSADEQLKLLDDFSIAFDAKDLSRATQLAMAALSARVEEDTLGALLDAVVHLASLYEESAPPPPDLQELLCRAVRYGFSRFAYSAANSVMENAKSVAEYQDAEQYFKIAMAYAENPAIQAAAYVNYCPIIRDGLISGEPDWPRSIEIYEVAAKMGLVKAMFNAGNMCVCMANKGAREYGDRAAYWFKHAIAVRDAAAPTLDLDLPEVLAGVFEQCEVGLMDLHIYGAFAGADETEGISRAKALAARGNPHAAYSLGAVYTRRLKHLASAPKHSPGANWQMVLAMLDWRFEGIPREERVILATPSGETTEVALDRLTVRCKDGRRVPLYVAHHACLPVSGGQRLLQVLAKAVSGSISEDFFLLPRKARFQANGDASHTPIYVRQGPMLSQQALWLGCGPEDVLQNASDKVDFLDPRFGVENCWISIALNALDEGLVVAGNAVTQQPYVNVGESWCMPFFSQENLATEFGILLQRR